MDLRADTSLTSYSQFCIYHVVKTRTRRMWEGTEMDPTLQLPGLASGYQALQRLDTYQLARNQLVLSKRASTVK